MCRVGVVGQKGVRFVEVPASHGGQAEMSTPALLSNIVSGRVNLPLPPPPRLVHDPQRPACVRGEGRVSKEGREAATTRVSMEGGVAEMKRRKKYDDDDERAVQSSRPSSCIQSGVQLSHTPKANRDNNYRGRYATLTLSCKRTPFTSRESKESHDDVSLRQGRKRKYPATRPPGLDTGAGAASTRKIMPWT